MAGRILNRRELRKQADHAEAEAPANGAGVSAKVGKGKEKAAAVRKVRKARPKKEPPRLRARWGVFDAGMKQVAIFDYNQRALAEEKLADLRDKKKGSYFLQIVKEPIPEPALAPSVE